MIFEFKWINGFKIYTRKKEKVKVWNLPITMNPNLFIILFFSNYYLLLTGPDKYTVLWLSAPGHQNFQGYQITH